MRLKKNVIRMLFIPFISLVLFACGGGSSNSSSDSADNWPARSANIIVFSSAGGSTDLANRAIAQGMKESLGADIIASNMPGALGGTAVNYVLNQRHDGYRMVGISEGALGHGVLGLHTTSAKDWEYFMIGGTPGIISVRADSEYQTFAELYQSVVENPNKLKIATSVPGSIWNIQWLLSKNAGNFNAQFVPYPGSFPSQTAALSGEVDIVWTGLYGEDAKNIALQQERVLAWTLWDAGLAKKNPDDFGIERP